MTRLPEVARLAAFEAESGTPSGASEPAWPVLAEEAFHGLAGRYVRRLDPHTEADPAAILIQFLVILGNVIGRSAHFVVEADRHYLNLFAVLVGASSKARKGVSAGQVKRLFTAIDERWCERQIVHGLSTGEGLIERVRDPTDEELSEIAIVSEARGNPDSLTQRFDKRLLVFESEFASVLRVSKRDGNTLSATIRNAWDSGNLSVLTRNRPLWATGAHISIIGHITRDELLRYLDSTESANGFGNRFLWCAARRSKLLPDGGRALELDWDSEVEELHRVVRFARDVGTLDRDSEAREIWHDAYADLSEGRPGLVGAVTGRAEAQTMRLACLFALLDQSALIRAEHLLAGIAVWSYCEQSAEWIFGKATGDSLADEIFRKLEASVGGLTKSELTAGFSRHRKASELNSALERLRREGKVRSSKESTSGRAAERWMLVTPDCERSERSERSEGSP